MTMEIGASGDWHSFGAADPYYGVLADDRFKAGNIDAAGIDAFFESGVGHVDKVLAILNHTLAYVPRGNALDFGCGVGRLTNAFAAHFDHVVGLDISPGMLQRARSDSAKRGVGNVTYMSSIGEDGLRPNSFDLVHSYIVLQHIPTAIGEGIIRDMVRATKPGGVGAIHFTYGYAQRPLLSAAKNFVKKTRGLREIGNVLAGRPYNRPAMQMNCYAIPRVIEILNACGVDRFQCLRVDDWGNLGLFVFFEKTRREQPGWSNPKPD